MIANSVVHVPSTAARLAVFGLLCGIPTELPGQRVPPLGAGTLVRVTAPAIADTLLIGKVNSSFGADTLHLRPSVDGPVMHLPHTAIVRLEVNRRRSRWAEGFLLGGVIGAGSAYYAVNQFGNCTGLACGAAEAVSALAGGVVGGLIGAGVGTALKKGPDRWRPVRLREGR